MKMYRLTAAATTIAPNRSEYDGRSVPPPPRLIRSGVLVMITRPDTGLVTPVSQRQPGPLRVLEEHRDGVVRHLFEVSPETTDLLQEIVRDRDDVTADVVGLNDVQDL